MKIEYLGNEVKEVEIILTQEKSERFDTIYMQHFVPEVDKQNQKENISVAFQLNTKGRSDTTETWTLENIDDVLSIRITESFVHVTWWAFDGRHRRTLITSYAIPVDEIDLIKTDRRKTPENRARKALYDRLRNRRKRK
jgi:DNA-binding LytR/AlgR family response regulator